MGRIYLVEGGLTDETLKDKPSNPLNQARDYLKAYGHEVEIAYEFPEAVQLINAAVPDVLIVSPLVWPNNAFELIATMKSLYPFARTQFAFIVSRDAVTGAIPPMAWKSEVLSSFIMRPYAFQDIVLTSELLLYRRIAVAPHTISELRLRQLALHLTFLARNDDKKHPIIESITQLKALMLAAEKFSLKEEDFIQPGTSALYGVNRALSLLSVSVPPKRKLPLFQRQEKGAVVPQGEDIIAFYEREPEPDGARMVAFVRWNYPSVEFPVRRVDETEWQRLISHTLFRE